MKKLCSLCLAAVLSLALLSGCGEKQNQEAENQASTELETIVFTEPARVYHWAPAYLAQTLGYFEEVGLEADFQTITGADASTPVFTGDAQFGLRGIEMALMATEAGKDCKILLSTTSRFPYQLIGANQDYATVESLRGQVVAGGKGAASAPQIFAKAILMDEGLVPDQDTFVIDMFSSGYVAAMKSGDIQAAVATNPWSSKTLLENGGVVIVDGADDEAMQKLMGTSTYELFMVFASDEYIQENPETVQKAVTAMTKALKWMNEATPEEIATKLEPLFEGRYEELLYSAQIDKERQLYNPTGYHTESGYTAGVNLTKLSGSVQTDISADQVYNESFLDKAWEEIGE